MSPGGGQACRPPGLKGGFTGSGEQGWVYLSMQAVGAGTWGANGGGRCVGVSGAAAGDAAGAGTWGVTGAGGFRCCWQRSMRFVPQVLAAVVLLSWGFVLYGARVAAQRQLESGLLAQGLP